MTKNIIETEDFIVSRFCCGEGKICYQINEKNRTDNWRHVQITEEQLKRLCLWYLKNEVYPQLKCKKEKEE